MTGIRSAEPDAPDTRREVLHELGELGARLALWRFLKGEEAKRQRGMIRDEIRPVVSRGKQEGLTPIEIAKALGISDGHLKQVLNNNPSGRLPSDGTGASLSPGLRDLLHELGSDLRQWRYVRTDCGKKRRAELRAEIREIVKRSPQATQRDIAWGLGISLQALINIKNENTTGRPSGSSAYLRIDPELRELLQKLGWAWNNATGRGMAEMRNSLHESFLAAIEEAREAGLTLNEISDVSGISYGQVTYILHGSGAEKIR